ncbi:MAG: hypothetical protein C0432_03000 [Candidatus Puniceispirillum sp.]|nr:hypothetical protein [Candidatus Pelagibacter sp.]MBA4283244.1 hypothetical protein [Candidatus Puniceispirillum sp.]
MHLPQNIHFNVALHALKTIIEPSLYLSDTIKDLILNIDRHPFLPAIVHPIAYSDEPILLKKRCELPIALVALILETIYRKRSNDYHIFVMNSGTGFSTMLLSYLFEKVTTYEADNILYARLLEKMNHRKNVSPVMSTPQDENVFDVIFMDGGAHVEIPKAVKKTLKPGGILLVAEPHSLNQIDETLFISNHNYTKPFRYPLCSLNFYVKNNDQKLILDHVVCQTHLPLILNPTFTHERFVF